MKSSIKFLLVLLIGFFVSCGTNKKVVTTKKRPQREVVVKKEKPTEVVEEVKEELPKKVYKDAVEEYIDMYAETAKEEMKAHGIPASITLAQGILESGAGKGDLSLRANNHFGIKCHDWTGDRVYHDDDELQECFRKYEDPDRSYRDHSLFLTQRSRYSGLFKLRQDDYVSWAKGLKAAGYATDVKYPDKLIGLIERYQLYKYDAEVLGKTVEMDNTKVAAASNQNQHVVQKGDTLYSISRKYGISVEDLQKYNNLKSNTISIGQLLFIELPKD